MQQMKISIHLGVHCTDEDQLVKSLLKNLKVLSDEAVVVPGPGRYRPVVRAVLEKLAGQPPSQDTQDVLLEEIMETEDAERLVLSNEQFLATTQHAFRNGALYRNAARNTERLRRLFPDHPVEFFLAVRNPATFVPALHHKIQGGPFTDFIAGIDPDALAWSDVIRDIREANPETPITVWCNEDTPLIWPEVMHEITGIDPQVQLMGGFDILSKIMAREGVKRLRSYLTSHAPATEIQRRRVLSAFLDKYALEEEVEEELDLPGWTPELVDHLTNVYDDDMIEIGRIPGVTLLTA
jgi:hypothetical protein